MRPEHWLYRIPLRLRSLFRWGRADQDLDEGLPDHFERKTEEYLARGMEPEDAPRWARLDLAGVEELKEECRDARRVSWLQDLVQDIRYGLRMLRKNTGFTAVAVLTLALGIGANTAIFSIVNGVLLQPLSYPHSEELVMVARTTPAFDHPVPVSGLNFLDWRKRATQFRGLAGFDGRGFTIVLGKEPEHVLGAAISYNFLSVLHVIPALGRDFLSPEEHAGNDHVALVTDAFWKQRLGTSADVIGRTFILNGQSFTIVGVLPRGFRYVLMPTAQIFIPLNLDHTPRGANFMSVVGRIKPGVSLRQAQSEMDSIARELAKEYPADNAEQGAVVIPMLGRVGQFIRAALLILLGAVALILLIAIANIGNLMLVQALKRRGEIAVRSALGARAGRLVRQCLTESALVGLLGGTLGLVLGHWGLQAFRALNPGNVPRLEEIHINVRVLVFSLGISILASILFGSVPALRFSRIHLADTLKEGSARATWGTERGLALKTFVVAEIALSLVLLAGAGLAVRSFLKLISTDPGYDARNLLTFYLSPQVRKAAQAEEFYREVAERLSAIPGVVSVAMSRSIPPSGGEMDGPAITSEHPDMDPNRAPNIIFNGISSGYFRTMRLRLLAGREFSKDDGPDAPFVVILNEAAARSLFPDKNAVGFRVKLGDPQAPWWTIVGVVADERYFGWDSDRTPTAYLPVPQILHYMGDGASDYDSAVIIRTTTDPFSFLPAVRSAVGSVNKQMALLGPESMEQRLNNTFAPHRFNMILLAAFAGLALLLAAVGVYGVMAQFVSQRTHEIGVRVALGARSADVVRLVLGQAWRLGVLGAGTGIVVALAATRLIRSLLYGISADDPVTFVSAAFLLIGAVLLACYLPARRATRVDPMVALRYE